MNIPALITAASIAAACAAPVHGQADAAPDDAAVLSRWVHRINLSGTLEGETRWMRHHDISEGNSPPASDLYIRTVDIGIETAFPGWASATAVMNSEWIGDPLNAGDEKMTLDEVHLDVAVPGTPAYLVLGKRTQPFGLFESAFNTDPLTQDAYETKKIGATLGFRGPLDSDFSVTAYKGREQMAHLLRSGLFDTSAVRSEAPDPLEVGSFIVSGTLSPAGEDLILFGGVLSEPGRGVRNATLNAGFHVSFPWHENLVLDCEFMKALKRELYAGCDRPYRESAASIGLSYLVILKERAIRGGPNYANRKVANRTRPFMVALRVERFDDDGLSGRLGAWTAKSRCSLGGKFSFYDDRKISSYVRLELRNDRYRLPRNGPAGPGNGNWEAYARFGIDF
jgi:hypothetical protein